MTKIYNPPPFVDKIPYKSCQQVNLEGKRVYLTPDGEKLPSVTTILSATKDMTHLNEWRRRIGEEKAAQITREAASRGTLMHKFLENFIIGNPRSCGTNLVHQFSNKMADTIIKNGLSKMDEVWAIEQSLYFPGLYSGTTDGIGIFQGELCIFDFKQSNKPKKIDYIEDYFIQLLFYGTAHNEVYGTDIKKGIIFMAVSPSQNQTTGEINESQYQEFIIDGDLWEKYKLKMWDRLEKYYELFK